ncbi:MAG TPA: vWA domain-containing protein [Verrucomicrobiae bacterium]|nr:vWA domain-containing protein [Verrucomicrobiae bacterium]
MSQSLEDYILLASWAALGVAALAALGEWLHARRMRRLGRLAFGPQNRPRSWVFFAAVLRVLALAAAAWSLVLLLAFEGSSRAREENVAATRHLLVLLDVSPSMQLEDAGENGHQTRATRAAALLRSVLNRAPSAEVKITMACFYTHAMQLVKECADREVIANFTENLPLHLAYRPGKTDLVKSLNQGGELAKDFPRKTTTVLVLTDGDTVPDQGLNPMPSAVSEVIIAGVGDAARGVYIDGHLSRQDSATLSQVARRLGGRYHNGNTKHIPSEWLLRLTASDRDADKTLINLRVLAVALLAISAALLCLLPVLLEYAGSPWKPITRPVAPSGARPDLSGPRPADATPGMLKPAEASSGPLPRHTGSLVP